MTIEKKQEVLLLLLRDFNTLCQKNQIKYSLACGTALGCVREKGFIKWDGDLDVMMTLHEYYRMEQVAMNSTHNFILLSYKTTPMVPTFFGRIYPKNTDTNNLENYCYIDIHVYCNIKNDITLIKKTLRKNQFRYKMFWVKNRKYHHLFRRKKSFIGFVLQKMLLPISSKRLVSGFFGDIDVLSMDNSEIMVDLPGYYGVREMIPKTWMESFVEKPFENITVPIISSWDLYLKQLYGDYLTPKQYRH